MTQGYSRSAWRHRDLWLWVFVLEAADAMCKAGDVTLIGYENTASGYISILVEGDVAAVEAAVEAGRLRWRDGAEVHSPLSFLVRIPILKRSLQRYCVENLLLY